MLACAHTLVLPNKAWKRTYYNSFDSIGEITGRDLLGIRREKILSIFETLFTEQIQVKKNHSGKNKIGSSFAVDFIGNFSFQYDTFVSTRK